MTFETFDPTEDFQIFGRFSDFLKIFRFLKDFQIFGRFSDFWRIFRFLEDFQIFERFSDFWTILGLVTFETLITILTIDNLCYLTINCDTGQHSQFLRCFYM